MCEVTKELRREIARIAAEALLKYFEPTEDVFVLTVCSSRDPNPQVLVMGNGASLEVTREVLRLGTLVAQDSTQEEVKETLN